MCTTSVVNYTYDSIICQFLLIHHPRLLLHARYGFLCLMSSTALLNFFSFSLFLGGLAMNTQEVGLLVLHASPTSALLRTQMYGTLFSSQRMPR
ncbi:hypothetical protein FGO68_gene12344 [Halteria grandinella]|uniref:Uncharacterized protein n=1 Tax=Halteria grandinella TaxID=5974 RepID=A0A8J8NNH5_HALGN|nr:hypothetical protein FGO68_gene12344 [Halteria grandinella]